MSGDIFDLGRSNEALRFGNKLLFNFAKRIENGNPRKLEKSYFDDLLTFAVPHYSVIENPEMNYSILMMDVRKELNIFINGSEFGDGENSSVAIQDPDYLDALADILQNLDGITGFIIAGNPNASEKLLKDLIESNFYLTMGGSTKDRAQANLDKKV